LPPAEIFALTLADVGVTRVRACQISLGIGLFHILIFYFLWVFGEVSWAEYGRILKARSGWVCGGLWWAG